VQLEETIGTDVSVDLLRRCDAALRGNLFPGFVVKVVKEADRVPAVALLATLGKLPSRAAFLCTTNLVSDDIPEPVRSWFPVLPVEAPTEKEIYRLLAGWELAPEKKKQVAIASRGNVREATIEDSTFPLVSLLVVLSSSNRVRSRMPQPLL
jgi:hypothetical protein